MERPAGAALITFFCNERFSAPGQILLGTEAAQHLRVLRAGPGQAVALRDGKGGAASGLVARLAKRSVTIDVTEVSRIEAQHPVHLMVPVADRDRMLMLAEKCTELSATSWRPVMWRRSRSVGPLGDGPAFQARVQGRMVAALTQSGGGWLPDVHPSAPLSRAMAAAPAGTRLMLDARAEQPLAVVTMTAPVVIAIGPEGGIEPSESAELISAGFTPVRIAGSVLRFETAGMSALAVVRCLLDKGGSSNA